jgi:hypothetical protein
MFAHIPMRLVGRLLVAGGPHVVFTLYQCDRCKRLDSIEGKPVKGGNDGINRTAGAAGD